MAHPSFDKVRLLWGDTVARYYADPGPEDLYLSTPKKAPEGTFRFFVPGTRTLKELPHLAAHPVIFEKQVFMMREGAPTTIADIGRAKDENRKSQDAYKVFSAHMPKPLGLRKAAFLSAAIKARSIKSIIPYESGRDGIANMGPILLQLAATDGKSQVMQVWKALDTAWMTLSKLHSHGIAHGDVHMSNVMIARNGDDWRAALIDFARAREANPKAIRADQQVLMNHGRVVQALIGPQKGEFAEMSREMGFQHKPETVAQISFLERRLRPVSLPKIYSVGNAPSVAAPQVSRGRSIA